MKRHVNACPVCQRARGPPRRPKQRLKAYQTGRPWQRIAIDFLGPLPVTENGSRYIMVVGDYFSKWIEAFPLRDQTAETTANTLWREVCCRYGVPEELHTDQGRNFESELFSSLCERLSVHKTRTTPYHPQSDGMVERWNRTVLLALRKVADVSRRWDLELAPILLHYNAVPHAATGLSPAFLQFGRELRIPLDVAMPPAPTGDQQTPATYATQLEEDLRVASRAARTALGRQWNKMERNTDGSPRLPPIREGALVRVFEPQPPRGISPKLAGKWSGPYPVVEAISQWLYRVRFGSRRGDQVVHRNRLWVIPRTVDVG